jgi:hypothetical protein
MQLRAYLVSGEFRVHRADCRDCQREARRSDSPGHPEEYASQADVIASLWSDIIAENPELYGTPGGLASLEAETIFLPCTAGLPETSPAGDNGEPGDAEELAAWAAGLGLEAGDLDDLVHDAYSRQASQTNNDGLDAQVKLLIESTAPRVPALCSATSCRRRSSACRRLRAGSACRPRLPSRAASPTRRGGPGLLSRGRACRFARGMSAGRC